MNTATEIAIFTIIMVTLSSAGAMASDNTSQRAIRAMRDATRFFRTNLSCHGGYLGEYSEDLTVWIGEGTEAPTRIWVQPPGTPTFGQTYLRAYQVTGDERYLEAAVAVADSLIWGQMESGGWRYVIDFLGEGNYRYRHEADGDPDDDNWVTFDDDVSQSAIRLLMGVDQIMERDPYTEATMYALDFMMESQFPNGAWPQVYPLSGDYPDRYSDYYTFNDQVINDCISTMMEAYELYGDHRYLKSAERAGDFIIKSQLQEPQPGWAQQYDWDMNPAWARSFEPPAVCSRVTGDNIETLLELYLFTGNETYLEPIPAAIEWFNRSRIGEDTWARFYELGTNIPIYCDRDRKLTYNISDLGDERRYGYGWQGGYGKGAIRMYQMVMDKGREDYLAWRNRELTEQEKEQRAEEMEDEVNSVIDALDEWGRWVDDGWIISRTFHRNMDTLLDYLEYRNWSGSPPQVPSFGELSMNSTEQGLLISLEVNHPAGKEISGVIFRLNPRIEGGLKMEMRDDGTGPDRFSGDGRYSLLLNVSQAMADDVFQGYLLAIDKFGEWNLTKAPVGTLAEIMLTLDQVQEKLEEARGLNLSVGNWTENARDLEAQLGVHIDGETLAHQLEQAENIAFQIERDIVSKLIDSAAEAIEMAKDKGIDTSRHEIFLERAREFFDEGQLGPARKFTEYPLRLRESISEGITFLVSVLMVGILVGSVLRKLERTT